MSFRHLHRHPLESDPIPWRHYVIGVGGALTCMLFAADALIPKAEPRPYHPIDKTVLRVQPRVAQTDLGLTSFAATATQRTQ